MTIQKAPDLGRGLFISACGAGSPSWFLACVGVGDEQGAGTVRGGLGDGD